MEPFYYSKMNKMQQAAYHAICQGVLQMEKEIQVPRMSGEDAPGSSGDFLGNGI